MAEAVDMRKFRIRGVIKFLIWTTASGALIVFFWVSYFNGTIYRHYYYKANMDGYAINAFAIAHATKDTPAFLKIGPFESVEGLQAAPVKKGDRLPGNATGIISKKIVGEGKRAALHEGTLKVMIPKEIREARGVRFIDTFKHKGVETNPWGAVWSVAFILFFGASLGLMAEGFTDMMGLKIKKIKHYEGVH